jgi:hypothetical protein
MGSYVVNLIGFSEMIIKFGIAWSRLVLGFIFLVVH